MLPGGSLPDSIAANANGNSDIRRRWPTHLREQLELLDTPGGRIHLSELLPAQDVAIDETWSVPEAVMCRLLCLDTVTQCEVKATLTAVTNGVANVQFEGNVAGTVSGTVSEVQLKAKYHFDIKTSQITWLGMAIREERAIGHAEPGFETLTKVAVTSAPIVDSPSLADEALGENCKLDADTVPMMLQFKAAKAGFQLLLDRRWRVLTDRTDLTVLRFVEQGESIAQCNLSILPNLAAGKQVSMEELQADIKQSLE